MSDMNSSPLRGSVACADAPGREVTPDLLKQLGMFYHCRAHCSYQDGSDSKAPTLLFAGADYEAADGSMGLREDAKYVNEPAIIYVRLDSYLDALGVDKTDLEWSYAEREWNIRLSERLRAAIMRLETIAETHPEIDLKDDLAFYRDVALAGRPARNTDAEPNMDANRLRSPRPDEPVFEVFANGKIRHVDASISNIVRALNEAGIPTIASCSGHGNRSGNIVLVDGRELVIAKDYQEARAVDRSFPDIHGKWNPRLTTSVSPLQWTRGLTSSCASGLGFLYRVKRSTNCLNAWCGHTIIQSVKTIEEGERVCDDHHKTQVLNWITVREIEEDNTSTPERHDEI